MREAGSGTRKAVQNLFAQHDVTVQVRLELGSNEAIKQAIAGGLGLSVLSKHTLNTDLLLAVGNKSEVVILDVQHFPIHCRWYVAYLAGKQLSVVAETFLQYLLTHNPPLVSPHLSLVS